MRYFFIITLSCALSSCSKDKIDGPIASDLNGKWIEVQTKLDTLTFESWDEMEIVTLGRGKETINGHLLPKLGSGPYQYRFTDEKISLYWMLSSDSRYNDHSFMIAGNKLYIGNFYSSSLGPTLTFKKSE